MEHQGRVLIADDEEIFLHSTADLLRREGFECDCVLDADAALELLHGNEYDLLIADIKMPGNPELELVHKLPEVAPGLPVILVTGYPSLRSAIQSVQLPVAAYMVKPIDIEELLGHVRTHTELTRAYRLIRRTRERIESYTQDLGQIEQLMRTPVEGAASAPVEAFMTLHVRNIVDSLSDLQRLMGAAAGQRDLMEVEVPSGSPGPTKLLAALEKTIAVLEKTKTAFKSKDLGELRKELEELVKESRS